MSILYYKDPVTGEFKEYKPIAAIPQEIKDGAAKGMTALQEVPMATGSVAGLVKAYDTWGGFGVRTNASGQLYLQRAYDVDINSRESDYNPIVPRLLNYAVKAALSDEKKIVMTDTEKVSACATIGAETKYGTGLLASVTVAEDVTGLYVTKTNGGEELNALEFAAVVRIPQITGDTSYLNSMYKVGNDGYRNFPTGYNINSTRTTLVLYALEEYSNMMIPRMFAGREGGTLDNPQAFGTVIRREPIKGFYISQYRTGTALIPAGTTVEIYGRQVQ